MEKLFEQAITQMMDSGYAVCDDVLSETLVQGLKDNLRDLFTHDALKQAGIGKWNHFQKDRSIRSDKIHWIPTDSLNGVERAFLDIVDQCVNYLNATCYTGIKSYEFHYALYEKGAFYKKHIDRFANDQGRQYTMIFYLNENWEEADGGALILHKEEVVKILPVAGRMVFFESHKIIHEVKPALKERMSITGWLKNVESKILP